MAVIDCVYLPNPSQDDQDLALLVLKFGGPSPVRLQYSKCMPSFLSVD